MPVAGTSAADCPVEIIFAACAALHQHVTESNQRRILRAIERDPAAIHGCAGDPIVEAAFTAFLRHPFSTPSAAQDARKLGRTIFLGLAMKHMRRYMMQLSRRVACSAEAQLNVGPSDLGAAGDNTFQSSLRKP